MSINNSAAELLPDNQSDPKTRLVAFDPDSAVFYDGNPANLPRAIELARQGLDNPVIVNLSDGVGDRGFGSLGLDLTGLTPYQEYLTTHGPDPRVENDMVRKATFEDPGVGLLDLLEVSFLEISADQTGENPIAEINPSVVEPSPVVSIQPSADEKAVSLEPDKPALFSWLVGEQAAAALIEDEIKAIRTVLPKEGEFTPAGYSVWLTRAREMAKALSGADVAYIPAQTHIPNYVEVEQDWLDRVNKIIEQQSLDGVTIRITYDANGYPKAQAFNEQGEPLDIVVNSDTVTPIGAETPQPPAFNPLDPLELALVRRSANPQLRQARQLAAMGLTEDTRPQIGVDKWPVLVRALQGPFKTVAEEIIMASRDMPSSGDRKMRVAIADRITELAQAMDEADIPHPSLANQPIGWEHFPKESQPKELTIISRPPGIAGLLEQLRQTGVYNSGSRIEEALNPDTGLKLTVTAPCQCGQGEIELDNVLAVYRGTKDIGGQKKEVYELMQGCECPHCHAAMDVYLGEPESNISPMDQFLSLIQATAARQTGYSHTAHTTILAKDKQDQIRLAQKIIPKKWWPEYADGKTGFYDRSQHTAVCSPNIRPDLEVWLNQGGADAHFLKHLIHESIVHPHHRKIEKNMPEQLRTGQFEEAFDDLEECAARLADMGIANRVIAALPQLGLAPIAVTDASIRANMVEPKYERVYDELRTIFADVRFNRDMPDALIKKFSNPEGMAEVCTKYLQAIGLMPKPEVKASARPTAMEAWRIKNDEYDRERLEKVRKLRLSQRRRPLR